VAGRRQSCPFDGLRGTDDGTAHAGLTRNQSRPEPELMENPPAAFDIANVKRTI
jgi:hypothetical protein